MHKQKSKSFRFINGAEGREHFDSLAKFNAKQYRDRMAVKLWPGQFLAVFDLVNGEPTIKGKLRVLDLSANQDGTMLRILNQSTGDICLVRHVPVKLFNYDIALCLPQTTSIERTVKFIQAEGRPMYNVACMATVMHRAPPLLMTPEMDRLASWDETRRMFSSTAAFNAEIARFAKASALSQQQAQSYFGETHT